MDLYSLQKRVKEIDTNLGRPLVSLEEKILALHESATKIWEARDVVLKQKRTMNAFMSLLLIADEVGIADIEQLFEERLAELEHELHKA